MSTALETDQVAVSFGGVRAVKGITLRVEQGERRVIIGPNGAGKTTFFNLIAGQLSPSQGRILLFDEDVTTNRAYQRARRGLARTFQISRLFNGLTVIDNMLIAADGPLGLSPRLFKRPQSDREKVERIERLLSEWGLADQGNIPVQEISHGNQRLLEIALALATEPRIVLLDEPTAGLSGGEREMVTARLRRLPQDVTVILTDHDMDVVFEIADRIMVLNQGEVVAEGSAAAIRSDARVHEIYFGEE